MTATMTADDVRLRLRELLTAKHVSQAELTRRLTRHTGDEWLVDHVSKLLRGEIRLRVEDVIAMCEVGDISLVELWREPGRDFVADLTPSELTLLQAIRAVPKLTVHITGILTEAARDDRTTRVRRAVVKRRGDRR